MAKIDFTAPRCTERVPERLCGGLRGDDRPVCRRFANHGGKCRAQRRLRGVGTTQWEWKPGDEENVLPQTPTFIEPQVIVKQWAPKESVTKSTCRCNETKHKCKKYRGLLR